MYRREFMGVCAGAAVTAAATGSSAATLPTFAIAGAETEGVPFSLTVMLWTVYRDLPFPQRLEKVAEARSTSLASNSTAPAVFGFLLRTLASAKPS